MEIIVDRMMREFGVQAGVGRPQVAYRETIRKNASAEGRYIRQTGGRGQYGHCKLEVHPLPSSKHENMHEMSTDELDALSKQVAGGGGTLEVSTRNIASFSLTRLSAAPFPGNISRPSKRAFAKPWTPEFWPATKWLMSP